MARWSISLKDSRRRGARGEARRRCQAVARRAAARAESAPTSRFRCGEGRSPRGRIHPVSQVTDEITDDLRRYGLLDRRRARHRDRLQQFHRAEHSARASGAAGCTTRSISTRSPTARGLLLRTHTVAGADPHHAARRSRRSASSRRAASIAATRDQTHTPMFHQVEGLVIDEETHLGHLKWVLEEFCKAFFEVPTGEDALPRQPLSLHRAVDGSRYPATPRSGDEIRIGEGDQWLEILGCGMVHPNVLQAMSGSIPTRYQGFAFGMGIDRIAMLKYGMPDLRAFFDGGPALAQALRLPPARRADARRRTWS